MLGIVSVGYQLPQSSSTIERYCASHSLSEERRRALERNGAEHYFYAANSEGLVGMASGAIGRALADGELTPDQVDLFILCHTSPTNALPMPYTLAGILRQRCGLTRSYAFSISQQQCVSSIHALRVAGSLLAKNRNWRYAVVLNADVIINESYRIIGDAGIHSDAASAMLVSRDSSCRLRSLHTYNAPKGPQSDAPEELYASEGSYVWVLVSVIRRALGAASLGVEDLASVLPHNVNLPAWRRVLEALRLPQERLFDQNFKRVGHGFGSDAVINIADSRALSAPGHHLVVSSGIGGCFGSFIFSSDARP